MLKAQTASVFAVILAGGRARRLHGQDKGLLSAGGYALAEYSIRTARQLTDSILISANRHLPEYSRLGYPVVSDSFGHYAGPLAGILTVLGQLPEDSLLLVLPCDMPTLPASLPQRLLDCLLSSKADYCCVEVDGRLQPLVALMHTRVRRSLQRFLQAGQHRVQDWVGQLQTDKIVLDDPHHCACNINTPEALAAFQQEAGQ